MSSQAAMGQKALEDRDYGAAIKHYTEALKSSNSPLWLNSRSTAYQRQGLHELALYDAEDAVLEAMSRGRRELIAASQFRRAIALFGLKRYGDSRLCFTWVRKLNEKEKGLGMWQAKVKLEYDKLDEDAEGRKTTVNEAPEKRARTAQVVEATSVEAPKDEPALTTVQPATKTSAMAPSTAQTPKDKIKHEWYQSSSKVNISIFAKNVPKSQADIKFSPQSVSILTICGPDFSRLVANGMAA
jgi:suppressor of G2 allele of SKP1